MTLSEPDFFSLLVLFSIIRILRILCYKTILENNNFIDYKHFIYDLLISFIVYHIITITFDIIGAKEVFLFDTIASVSLLFVYVHMINENNQKRLSESYIENEEAISELQKVNAPTSLHKPIEAEISYPNKNAVFAIISTPYWLLIS